MYLVRICAPLASGPSLLAQISKDWLPHESLIVNHCYTTIGLSFVIDCGSYLLVAMVKSDAVGNSDAKNPATIAR